MESAAERKARLKALRAARDDKVGGEKKLKFRNYLPQSEELAPAFEPPPLPELQAPPPPLAEDDGDTPAARFLCVSVGGGVRGCDEKGRLSRQT